MSKRAVIIVDLQKDYLASGSFPLTGIDAAAANAARIAEAARSRGDRVVHIHHVSREADSPLFAPNTDGIRPIPAVAPRDGDTVIVRTDRKRSGCRSHYENHIAGSQRRTVEDGLHGLAGAAVRNQRTHHAERVPTSVDFRGS